MTDPNHEWELFCSYLVLKGAKLRPPRITDVGSREHYLLSLWSSDGDRYTINCEKRRYIQNKNIISIRSILLDVFYTTDNADDAIRKISEIEEFIEH